MRTGARLPARLDGGRYSSARTRLQLMDCNTFEYTRAALTRRMRSSLARRSTPCFGGIRTLRAATPTFRMSLNRRELIAKERGKRLFRQADGLHAVGHFKSLSQQGWLTSSAQRGSDLGASCRLRLRYKRLPASQRKPSKAMRGRISASESGGPGPSAAIPRLKRMGRTV
jgi:hypothetical protein